MTIDERSLDEAILEFKERAEDSRKMSELGLKNYIPKEKEEKQIAEWLEELKEYKKNSNTCPMCDTYCSYIAEEFENGYNKAIDDCKELTFREVVYCDSLNDRTEFRELAEQLKAKNNERKGVTEK